MIYIGTFAVSIGLIWLSEHSKVHKLDMIALLLLCILAGLRASSVGTDYTSYLIPIYRSAINSHSFDEFLNSSWFSVWHNIYVKDWEIGFTSIVYIITKCTGSIRLCAFAIEALIIFHYTRL